MSIESELKTQILAISGISAYVGTSAVYPVYAPTDATTYIVYRRINTDTLYTCGSRNSKLKATFRITCWTKNHDDVIAFSNYFRAGMDTLSIACPGTWGSYTVQGLFWVNEVDEFSPSIETIEKQLHGRSLDYEIHYVEEIPS